ncbi:interferon alpha/beta receptor 1a-like isoform X2 [Colossoma macropomum]|uniref:interferon alpha/beta receptor 1a-like isoform X2 n=1 Tax=Colossoma macropomum TaxID=42526 RepID=UPI001863E937|nr:interferon alpha/beta receptor 1a-like isoform X2 [Colossoma macropomum]
MPLYLHVGLNLLVLFSASASLSSPYDVRMIAVDLNYTLQWAWSDSQLNDSVNFTAAYAFWNIKDDEGSYKQACAGSGEHWCDFTHCKLHFKGSFQTRVRAEAAGRHSNWTHLRFTPDEHVLLGPPSEVNMQGDVEMVILNISKSVMNSLMKVQYEVQYWEQQQPDQKHLKIYNDPYAPLTSLKPWTEYCLQVRVFNKDYSKNSSFTSPRSTFSLAESAHCAVLYLTVRSCSIHVLQTQKKDLSIPNPQQHSMSSIRPPTSPRSSGTKMFHSICVRTHPTARVSTAPPAGAGWHRRVPGSVLPGEQWF